MESFAKDFVAVLQYLLPGFVSAWVIYSLTSYALSSSPLQASGFAGGILTKVM